MAGGHGGNLRELAARAGRDEDRLLDFSASLNPLGPPKCLRAITSRSVERLVHYPDPDSLELVRAIAARWRFAAEEIVVGNGSSEILFALARACHYDRAVIPMPSYIDYAAAVERAGKQVTPLELDETKGFVLDLKKLEDELHGGELVFLGQPNNPTGLVFDADEFRALAARRPASTFVVDEAFADFLDGYQSIIHSFSPLPLGEGQGVRARNSSPSPRDYASNIIVVRSFTKFYAIAGLRLGFAVARPDVAGQIRRQMTPWSVGALAAAVGAAVLADDDYARRTIAYVGQQRRQLGEQLQKLPGFYVYPGRANFLLVRLDRADVTAPALAARLLQQGIAIRTFDAAEWLDGRFFRVAVRTAEENRRLCDALAESLDVAQNSHRREPMVRCMSGSKPPASAGGYEFAPLIVANKRPTRKTPALMFQGASSNAGKSVLTAAMCRILFQDGLRVAPFKSQNMSLNSFVTREGREMGRAQAVQAQACRLEPDVRMNPILLKPNSDTGSQVIVRGEPAGNMRVAEYVRFKPQAWAAARECYDSLAAEFDVVVLEGAGSPGEMNLKHHDIVNMRMAEYAAAPVLVVGDIDRGGVFASFVGTMEVLDPWERQLLAGWIVNRFRGDSELLGPALEYTANRTGRPVLGVVPYLASLGIPQEDSVEFKSGLLDAQQANGEAVEIALVDLPHISNFTDIDALRGESDVRLRIVRSPADLRQPDAVIIPGSKNTLADLGYLRRSGLAEQIERLARQGRCEVVGICGGFQMLGREIRDPLGLESPQGKAAGLGLLGLLTVLAAEKTLLGTSAVHAASGMDVVGYEIHHGQTELGDALPLLTASDGRVVGAGSGDGRVWGTYLHGAFDADLFRRWFIDRLRARRGLTPLGRVVAPYTIEPALDRLADAVRRSLNMNAIYRLMGL